MENGAIMNAASRWPLMIDPQLQGVRWIVSKEAKNGLVIIQQSQPKYIDQASRHVAQLLYTPLTCTLAVCLKRKPLPKCKLLPSPAVDAMLCFPVVSMAAVAAFVTAIVSLLSTM